MKTIFISCGHNLARNWIKNENGKWVLGTYRDQGAVNPSDKTATEYRWVRRVSDQIKKIGSKKYQFVFVPEGLNLDDRIKFINSKAVDGDVCIELHMNSGGGTGVETFAHSGSTYAMNLAGLINNVLSANIGTRNRGAKPDTATRFGRLGFVRDTKPLAFLIELGFIDSPIDRDKVWLNGAGAVIKAIEKVGL